MRLSLLVVAGFLLFSLNARADQFDFQPTRVESMKLTTTKDGAHLVAKVFDKVTNTDTVEFKLELKKKGDNVFVSPKGITIALTHLTSMHNEGHTIDNGDWEMKITGSGDEYQKIRDSANEDGDSTEKEAVFYGSKKK